MIIHYEDPEVDCIDVLERYKGRPIVTTGADGYSEIFDEDGCTVLDDVETKRNSKKYS